MRHWSSFLIVLLHKLQAIHGISHTQGEVDFQVWRVHVLHVSRNDGNFGFVGHTTCVVPEDRATNSCVPILLSSFISKPLSRQNFALDALERIH